jgi:hypothetical protein
MKNIYLLGTLLALGALGCSNVNPRVMTRVNEAASLQGDLPWNPLQWKVITSAINKRDSTMYTLFGNDVAVQYARSSARHAYPAGSVLSLVTWNQQEDPRWFGGKIQAAPRSVEFVAVANTPDNKPVFSYQFYEGTPLKKVSPPEGIVPDQRAAYMVALRAAVMP